MTKQTLTIDYRAILTGYKRVPLAEERVGIHLKSPLRLHGAYELKDGQVVDLGPISEFLLIQADGPFALTTTVISPSGQPQAQRTLHNRLFATFGAYASVSVSYTPRVKITDRPTTKINVLIA